MPAFLASGLTLAAPIKTKYKSSGRRVLLFCAGFGLAFSRVCLFSVRCLVLFRFLLLASSGRSCCACVSLLLVGGAGGRCSVFVLPVSLCFWGSVAGRGVVCSSWAVGSSRGVVALVVSLGWLLGLALVCS